MTNLQSISLKKITHARLLYYKNKGPDQKKGQGNEHIGIQSAHTAFLHHFCS